MITKEEFERQYAERSGVTVEWLRAHGRRVVREECDSPDCQGWAMAHAEWVPDRNAIPFPYWPENRARWDR